MSATKLYCLSSGKLPPCIEKTEDLKSTSKLKLTMSSFLFPLCPLLCVTFFLKNWFLFRLYYVQRIGEEGKIELVLQSPK